MEKNRDYKMDYIKGITIFLMVWGHIVQHLYGGGDGFYGNIVYKIIYTFHMPLFMFISGYFFKHSLDSRSLFQIIKLKSIQLGIPIIIWTTFYYVEDLLYTKSAFKWQQLFHLFFRRLWFLSAFLMLSIMAAIIWKFFGNYRKGFILTCILTGIFLLIVPDELFSAVYLKFMYPYFIGGILANEYKDMLTKHKEPIFILSSILYILLFTGFKDNYYVYTSGMYLPFNEGLGEQLFIIFYRYLIGLAGIFAIMGILEFFYRGGHNKLFIRLGNYTMEIYIIHIFFLNYMYRWNVGNLIHVNSWVYNLLLTPAISVLLILISIGIGMLLHKNKYIKGILFGNWKF